MLFYLKNILIIFYIIYSEIVPGLKLEKGGLNMGFLGPIPSTQVAFAMFLILILLILSDD